jgi:hypothetical protein
MHVIFERRITAGIPSHAFFTSERNKPRPLSSLSFLHKPPRICQDSRARPGCRKRKCRCGCVSPCGLCDSANCFCLAQDAKFGDHFFAMFLHVPHTHRGNGWPLLLSVAILRVRSRVTEYGSALCGLCHDLVLCRQCRCDDGDDG